jgi:hypothetical protein
MPWVVDTCIIIDVLDDDPDFGLASAEFLDRHAGDGLVICPVSYVELAPAFEGDFQRQDYFLRQVGIDCLEGWTLLDTRNAFQAWHRYVTARRSGRLSIRRPIADLQIGAFAERFRGLITRNRDYFASVFPDMAILVPHVLPG